MSNSVQAAPLKKGDYEISKDGALILKRAFQKGGKFYDIRIAKADGSEFGKNFDPKALKEIKGIAAGIFERKAKPDEVKIEYTDKPPRCVVKETGKGDEEITEQNQAKQELFRNVQTIYARVMQKSFVLNPRTVIVPLAAGANNSGSADAASASSSANPPASAASSSSSSAPPAQQPSPSAGVVNSPPVSPRLPRQDSPPIALPPQQQQQPAPSPANSNSSAQSSSASSSQGPSAASPPAPAPVASPPPQQLQQQPASDPANSNSSAQSSSASSSQGPSAASPPSPAPAPQQLPASSQSNSAASAASSSQTQVQDAGNSLANDDDVPPPPPPPAAGANGSGSSDAAAAATSIVNSITGPQSSSPVPSMPSITMNAIPSPVADLIIQATESKPEFHGIWTSLADASGWTRFLALFSPLLAITICVFVWDLIRRAILYPLGIVNGENYGALKWLLPPKMTEDQKTIEHDHELIQQALRQISKKMNGPKKNKDTESDKDVLVRDLPPSEVEHESSQPLLSPSNEQSEARQAALRGYVELVSGVSELNKNFSRQAELKQGANFEDIRAEVMARQQSILEYRAENQDHFDTLGLKDSPEIHTIEKSIDSQTSALVSHLSTLFIDLDDDEELASVSDGDV